MKGFRVGILLLWALSLSSCSPPVVRVVTDPLSAEEYLALGVAYEEKGEVDNAIAQYEQARKLGLVPQAELYLGNAWFAKGNLSRAEGHYRHVLRSDPSCADAMNNLAWTLLRQDGDLAEAEELVRRAIQTAKSSGDDGRIAIYRDTLREIQNRKLNP